MAIEPFIMDPRDQARLVELDARNAVLAAYVTDPREGRRNRALRQEGKAERLVLQMRLREALASTRGWLVAKTPFTFESLATGRSSRSEIVIADRALIDHPDYFRQRVRPYRPTALLTHSRETDREPFLALSRRSGVPVEFLDWSWYFPKHRLAALFIRM